MDMHLETEIIVLQIKILYSIVQLVVSTKHSDPFHLAAKQKQNFYFQPA